MKVLAKKSAGVAFASHVRKLMIENADVQSQNQSRLLHLDTCCEQKAERHNNPVMCSAAGQVRQKKPVTSKWEDSLGTSRESLTFDKTNPKALTFEKTIPMRSFNPSFADEKYEDPCYKPKYIRTRDPRSCRPQKTDDYITSYPTQIGSVQNNGQDLKRFLQEVGTDPKEARYWVKHFQKAASLSRQTFAVLQVEKHVLEDPDMLESLCSCLSFLQRHSMACVIVHGHHLPEGMQVTPDKLQRTRVLINEDSMLLATSLECHGATVLPFFGGSGGLLASPVKGMGLRGSIDDIDPAPIRWAISSGHIPIIQSVGESSTGQQLNLNVTEVTARIAQILSPLKVMFINTWGGLRDETGEVIPNVNLPNDIERVLNSEWCTSHIRRKCLISLEVQLSIFKYGMEQYIRFLDSQPINLVCDLLQTLPSESSVVLTSATTLLTELFTHHGSGTFFKETEPIHCYRSLDQVDMESLHGLIRKAFKKELNEGYFESLGDRLHSLYISEKYSAAAVITWEDGIDVPYLDKFVVTLAKQGEGLAELLWNSLKQDFNQLFWRAKNCNDINTWYFRRCGGSWSNSEWTVFWYGIDSHKDTSALLHHALSLPSSFQEGATERGEQKNEKLLP